MTKEQTIEKIKWSIHINELTKDINGSNTSINVEVLEKVLSMLEEKDKEIQFQEDINKTELNRHNKAEKNLKGIINKQNKIIDLMADEIANSITNTCPLEDYNYDLDCENKCNDNYKECWKQYFENKAKEVKND